MPGAAWCTTHGSEAKSSAAAISCPCPTWPRWTSSTGRRHGPRRLPPGGAAGHHWSASKWRWRRPCCGRCRPKAATRSFGIAVGALAVYGVGTSTGNVTYNSVLQTIVPDRLRGRVFAFYDAVWQTARLASIGVGGVLADTFGVVAVYWTGGLLLLAAGALGLTTGRTVDIDTTVAAG